MAFITDKPKQKPQRFGHPRKAIPKKVRERVLNKFGGRCAYCGEMPEEGKKLYVDHVDPHARRQDDSEENLNPACFPCNSLKTVYTLEQFRYDLEQQLERAKRYSVNFRMALKYNLIEEKPKKIKFYFETV